ncbi:hypothetical protein NPIL_75521 [Nephila pilipes]|uniref:Uncharacterized protein n=1 Tax=Nephila pilipes TaxID=299642 RepID=A0A8X6U353_NEPPI|nr:hypothetical protein NPIL_75521 [Nephila pilipes]
MSLKTNQDLIISLWFITKQYVYFATEQISSDKREFQNQNDEEYIELESDNDSEIIPRRKTRTGRLSESDNEWSHEKLEE